MRWTLPLVALLAAPLVGAVAAPLAEPAGDEWLTAQPLLFRMRQPVSAVGACHAPAVDLLGLDVEHGAETLVVRLSVDDPDSRAFSCPEIADGIGRPGYGVEFFPRYATFGALDAPSLILTASEENLRCWALSGNFFFPIRCELSREGGTFEWRIAAERVAFLRLHTATTRAIGSAWAAAGDLWLEDAAEEVLQT